LGKVRGKQRITRSVEERRFSARRAITGVAGLLAAGVWFRRSHSPPSPPPPKPPWKSGASAPR